VSAFQKAGLSVTDQRQHLGRPFGARYCWGAKSGVDVALSVCEYVDRSSAEKGAEQSRQASAPHREVRINQATSLTVRRIKNDATSAALSERLFDEFAKL